jgi:flavin-dependent dehydrogenase
MRVGIIGCSINGAYLAYRLTKDGHDVTVFEAKDEIGGKPCSGLVSERIWDFIPRNDSLIENKISAVELRFPNKKVEVEFSPNMLAVDRNGLDKYVAQLAEKAGAKIKLGHRAVKIIAVGKSKPHLVVETGGRTAVQEFDRIVGCDGANSFVREQAGAPRPSFRLGIYKTLKKKGKKGIVEVTPTSDGFRWKIPRGRTVEIGALEKPDKAKIAFKGPKQGRLRSAIIPEGLTVSRDNRLALCGDAAGLAKPWSGGGIIWGMIAANLLAASKLDIARYNRLLERRFGARIFFSRLARKTVYMLGNYAPFLLPRKAIMDSDCLY